jgi:hypothetical protein
MSARPRRTCVADAVHKVVLDTNQLVSSLLSTQGLQRQLINAWRRRAFLLFLAPGQIDEVAEVLGRPKIQKKYPITPGDREAFLLLLRQDACPFLMRRALECAVTHTTTISWGAPQPWVPTIS